MPRGKPFAKGDKRINRKGRPHVPKSVRELNQAIDQIFEEEIIVKELGEVPVLTDTLRATIRKMIKSSNPAGPIYILDRRFGKVKDEVSITSEMLNDILDYLPDDLLERIAQGEKVGEILVEWIASISNGKGKITRAR